MALEAPLRSSTGSQLSAFSPFNRNISSPDSFINMSSAGSESSTIQNGNSLRPYSIQRLPSANMNLMSPSDIVGPSPVTSNGTETTEIEDEEAEEPPVAAHHPVVPPQLRMLATNLPDHVRQAGTDEAVSVIHAPESFKSWVASDTPTKTDQASTRSSPQTDSTAPTFVAEVPHARPLSTPNPPPLSTNVSSVRYSLDSATPRAQDLQDMLSESSRLRSSSTSSLEKIEELREGETDTEAYDEIYESHDLTQHTSELTALRTALQECWTLCNTLASLSAIHRARAFNNTGTPDAHERAWMACWKLCQRLYDSRTQDMDDFGVRESLDLCRDFCQSLFDVRQRQDDVTDSVLRVSFELNNHLYSAQDSRNLPEAFRERTLDFYTTLCHRLMKQRNDLAEETDSLLKSCWFLAESLFNLRQNTRNGKAPDEELLGAAVQACWELCDIFREGWTAARPERNTPRPSQTSFFPPERTSPLQSGRDSRQSNRSSHLSKREQKAMSHTEERTRKPQPPPVPETPVTEFEDTPISPESQSPKVPNILVLGTNPESNRTGGGRWSSSASNLSSYSQSSARTSSTATTATAGEDVYVTRIKALMLKAAMNVGFVREATNEGRAAMPALQAFVKQLPAGSFGQHAALLVSYRNAVLGDAAFRGATSMLPSKGRRVSAPEMAKSVNLMIHRSLHYTFLKDLFKLVYGFPVEEADTRKNVSIAI
ncbi:hypothetical protein B0T11DRAFT_11430 [Plectosphaerella cucumerina]|uniref:DUF7624 domain-containing protein n=1 Tax=Plectosphaerella cucumerina TaxID=40658 RepID=A0A8K0TSD0_9PEZI|nr:hypothetical protein B0T11DRAFT_11430 [Plectosphaerella cucumerina]